MMLGSGKEIVHFMRATKSLASAIYVAKRLSKHALDVLRHGRGMTLTNGNALAGRLAKSAFDLKIPLWLSSPVLELVVEDGAVRGADIERHGKLVRVNAKRGVVLACGGFPHDVARRKAMFPHAPNGTEHFSPGPVGNTGDGLRWRRPPAAASRTVAECRGLGAGLDHRTQGRQQGRDAAFHRPRQTRRHRRDARRQRFANEGNSYHDFVQEMMKAAKPGEEITAYLLCDHRALRKYGLGCVPPFPMPLRPSPQDRLSQARHDAGRTGRSNWHRPKGIEATVTEFNASAVEGRDPAFGKGSRAYNRYQGDALHGPNPCIAPIKDGPFYAIKMVVGDLGTYAGIRTDEHARALDENGQPITGLYAAGNDMASIMGGNYPGAGITLGPALTFGYIAGKHIAASSALEEPPAGTNTDRLRLFRIQPEMIHARAPRRRPGHRRVFVPALAFAGDTEWRRYMVRHRHQRRHAGLDLHQRAGAPEGGTGRKFFTEDRRADLTVQSVPNPGNNSPGTFLAKQQPPAGIAYKRVTSDFFVVSSIRKDRIWYNRCNRGNGSMNCVMINYPVAERRHGCGGDADQPDVKR